MKYYEISYYKTRSWINKRYTKSDISAEDALKKSRIKNPIEITEITEERYNEYNKEIMK